jgi:hypothetical protein
MPERDDLLKAYSGKILGVRLYKSDKQELLVDDFMVIDVLDEFLAEVSASECDITPAGKSFLERYFGLERVAQMMAQRKAEFSREMGERSVDDIRRWLADLRPMEVATFIEEARGNLKEGATLRSDLLPPEEV